MQFQTGMQLGVMDNHRPDWLRALVPCLDGVGYTRYWATEQHNPMKSASPTIAAAIAGTLSERMRVGTAGVLLAFYSPLKVVEDFKLLQLMFSGRVDLGVAGCDLVEPMRSALLDGRPPLARDTYLDKVRTLVRLVHGGRAPGLDIAGEQLGPRCRGIPEIWVCGSTPRSARLAAELGVAYSFHDYLSAQEAKGDVDHGPAIVRTYLESFNRSANPLGPRFNVACYGVCAEISDRAMELWRQCFDWKPDSQPAPTPSFCGTPGQCREQLQAIADRYRAHELIVQSMTLDFDAYLTSYELLARSCQLSC